MEGSVPLASGPASPNWLDHDRGAALGDAGAAPRVSERPAESVAAELLYEGAAYPGDSRGRVRRRWMLGADLLALATAALIFHLLYGNDWVAAALAPTPLLFAAFPLFWVGSSALLGHYHLPERRLDYTIGDDLVPVLLVTTLAAWGGLVVTALGAEGVVMLGPWVTLWALTIALIHVSRVVMRRASVSRPWFTQHVLVVGTSSDLRRIRRRFERHPEFGLEIAAVAYLDPPGGEAGRSENGVASIHLPLQSLFAGETRRVSEIVDFALRQGVNRVLVATPPRGLDEREALARALSHAGFAVDIASTEVGGVSHRASLHHLEGLPIVTVPAIERGKAVIVAKRWFDILFSLCALTALAPLLIAIAVAIKLDSRGPVLFRQTRTGRRRRDFEMLKFRTMVDGADEMKDEIAEHNKHAEVDGGQMFKVVNDPRVTRVGAWLRRFSLDELPQLINVARGDMSIVGPRPLIAAEGILVDEEYEVRFAMRPGLTGPWQAQGRSDIGFDDMVRLDESYARNWTLAGDVSLILRTVGVVTNGRGAY